MLFLPVDPAMLAEAARSLVERVARRRAAFRRRVARGAGRPQRDRQRGARDPAERRAGVRAAPSGSRLAFERRLLLARRRIEIGAERRTGLELRRLLGVVAERRLQGPRRGRAAGRALPRPVRGRRRGVPLSHAVFHQRYATNTRPTWKLAQPFRLIAHNGEINTVRGNREELRGRRARTWVARSESGSRRSGRSSSADGSDSLSLDEGARPAAGRRLADRRRAAARASRCALDARASRCPEVDAFRARTAGLISPWDGPAALAFTDGYRVGVMLDRNGLRPAAVTVTTRSAGRCRLRGRRRARSPRPRPPSGCASGPARCSSWSRGCTRSATDADAKKVAVGASRRAVDAAADGAAPTPAERRHVFSDDFDGVPTAPHRAADPLAGRPRRRAAAPRHQDDGARGPRAALEHGRRHADARRSRDSTGRSSTTSASRSRRSPTPPSIPSASGS